MYNLKMLFVLPFLLNATVPPTCQTTCGPVAGIYNNSVYSFRGIPYAVPPVGKLRWRPPVPLSKTSGSCWNGTLNAQKFGNTCFQRSVTGPSAYDGSEDCLYLNVITPMLDPAAKKPVMVWIHGGSLQVLNGNWPLYSPTEQLASDTDVVYVSFNYRLQAFGFMALQLLADDSPTGTSGNYGFMDMILVLKWVQENIRNFGGDPNQVTVFGQSSGGTAIFGLLASPLCKGLFHKAWILSASPILNKTASDAYKDNEIFLKNSNCSDLNCLYGLTAAEVTSSVPWTTYPNWAMDDLGDLPTKNEFDGALAIVDGIVIPEAPFDVWSKGHAIDVPLIIGSCANEIDDMPAYDDLKNWTWTTYEEHVQNTIGTFGSLVYQTAMTLYPSNVSTPEFQFTSMASDIRVNCPNDVLTMYASSTFRSPVYRYVVTSKPSQPIHLGGRSFASSYSFHTWDVLAFFGFIKDYIKSPTPRDKQWQQNVREEILSFVHHGYPKTIAWQPYPTVTANLSSVTSALAAYNPVQCQFWLQNGLFSYAWIN